MKALLHILMIPVVLVVESVKLLRDWHYWLFLLLIIIFPPAGLIYGVYLFFWYAPQARLARAERAEGEAYSRRVANDLVDRWETDIDHKIAGGLTDSPLINESDELLSSSKSISWDEWYETFKIEAGKNNSQLEPSEEGFSMIDVMEHEPLKRAYKDGVDPRALARQFSAQYDIADYIP
jgi:hypothetical protein